jgi:hypothetical protein
LRNEKLRATEMRVHYCELEQGYILGEYEGGGDDNEICVNAG